MSGDSAIAIRSVVTPDGMIAAMVADYAQAQRRDRNTVRSSERREISVAYLSGAAHMIIVAVMASRGIDEETAAEIVGEMIVDYSINQWG